MTYEEVKKRLDELKRNKQLLRVKQRRIEELKQQISLSAVDYTKPMVQGCSAVPQQERYVEKLEQLTNDFSSLLDKVMSDEDLINDSAELLDPIEHAIIIERYLHNKSWFKIQMEFHYGERQPRRIERRALEKICLSRNDDRP